MADGTPFAGTAMPLPEAIPRRHASYRPVDELPEPVRHAEGYERFIAFAESVGAAPVSLARDVSALLAFLAEHPGVLDDDRLLDATGVFLGNALIARHPNASWRVLSEPEVGLERRPGFTVGRVVETVARRPELASEMLARIDLGLAGDPAR